MERSIACEIVLGYDKMRLLASEWRDLHQRAATCPFSCYDLIEMWWQTIGRDDDNTLHIIVARSAGRLVGVLPLCVRRKLGLRLLEFAGHEIFDYCGSLAENDGVAKALWDCARNSPYGDVAILWDVREKTRDYELLSAFSVKTPHNKAPVMNLCWKNSKEWQASRTRKHRRDYRYKLQRLEQRGAVRLEISGRVDEPAFDTMLRNKIAWCHQNKKTGVFSRGNIREAFLGMARIAESKDKLFLATLYCADQAVSHMMGFIMDGRLLCYFTSYEQAWAPYSPGTVLFEMTIDWAVDNGLKAFDFMRGMEGFKHRYANDVLDLPAFSFASSLRGYAGNYAFRTLFTGKCKAKLVAKRLPTTAQNALLSMRHMLKVRAGAA